MLNDLFNDSSDSDDYDYEWIEPRNAERLKKQFLRDISNPFTIGDEKFRKLYRMPSNVDHNFDRKIAATIDRSRSRNTTASSNTFCFEIFSRRKLSKRCWTRFKPPHVTVNF